MQLLGLESDSMILFLGGSYSILEVVTLEL